MLSLKEIAPPFDQRGMLVGKTGTGKTFLAQAMFPLWPSLLVCDPKCTLGGPKGLPGFEFVTDPKSLSKVRTHKIHFRPSPEFNNIRWWDSVFWWAFDRGNTFVFTDEVFLIMDGHKFPDGFNACLTSGRQKGVGMLNAAQRPSRIPVTAISEAEYHFMFRLQRRADRDTMSEYMGDIVREEPLTGFQFWHCSPDRDAEKMILKADSLTTL